MEVHLLGPLVVTTDDGPITVGAQKERALCTALALQAGRVVSLGELIDALWGPDPPATAAKTLQGYISKLRRALGPDVVVTERPGYLLDLAPDSVDVSRVASLVERARQAVSEGRTDDAAAQYTEALSKWRGDPLPDLALSGVGRREIERLIELRHAVREELLEVRVAGGEHHLAIPELSALVLDAPLRERAWELLMLALYRAGRQADALRAYQRVRELLTRQIGVEPGAALKDLESAIIAQDPILLLPTPSPSTPDARPVAMLAGDAVRRQDEPGGHAGTDGGTNAAPLPASLAWVLQSAFPFAGRDEELTKLTQLWDATVTTRIRHTALIGGEPGIGKTRLVGEAARAVDAEGGLVLFGACSNGLGAPYQPFVEALSAFARACPPALLGEVLGPLGAELTRLVPELVSLVPDLVGPVAAEVNTERHRLFEAVSEFLERLAAVQPVLLVLDDLQWATTPTLLLLRHVLAAARPAPLLIAATYRPTDLDRVHPLSAMLADLRRHERTSRISLEGLDEASTITLASVAADHELDADSQELIRRLHRECSGNPFFFWTMLTHLVEIGLIVRRDGRWTHSENAFNAALPEGIREVVAQRLSSLSDATNSFLQIAALLGNAFDYGVVAEVAGGDLNAVLDAMDLAEQSGVITEQRHEFGRFAFTHDLLRRSLEEELSTTRRARLHWRIAQVLIDRYGDDLDGHLDEVARHATEGALAGDLDLARCLVERAGDAALEALAFEEAASYYDDALGFVDPDDLERRVDLLLGQGRALYRSGNPQYQSIVREAITLARDGDEADQFAEAVLGLHHDAHINLSSVADAELRALLQEALEHGGAMAVGLRARLTSALALSLSLSDRERAVELSNEAVRLARSSDEPRVLAKVLADHSWAITGPDTVHDRIVLGNEIIALARRLGDQVGMISGYSCLTEAWLELGDLDRAKEALVAGLKLAEDLRSPNSAWGFKVHQGSLVMLQSDVATIEQRAEEIMTAGTELAVESGTLKAVYSRLVFAVRYECGTLAELEAPLTAMVEEQPAMPWAVVLAVIYAESGRADEARDILDRLAERTARRDLAWVVLTMLASLVVAEVGDEDLADTLYRDLLPFAGRNSHDGAGTCGPIDLALGRLASVLGRRTEAVGHFEDAAALCEKWRAPMWAAHTAYEHAKLLIDDAGTASDEAIELLDACATTARATGQTRLLDRASSLLRSCPA